MQMHSPISSAGVGHKREFKRSEKYPLHQGLQNSRFIEGSNTALLELSVAGAEQKQQPAECSFLNRLEQILVYWKSGCLLFEPAVHYKAHAYFGYGHIAQSFIIVETAAGLHLKV